MNLQTFLSKRDIELTLVNDHDESLYVGKAITVKPLKDSTYLRFSCTPKAQAFPFTKAVLHGDAKIFSILSIVPLRLTSEKTIELVY